MHKNTNTPAYSILWKILSMDPSLSLNFTRNNRDQKLPMKTPVALGCWSVGRTCYGFVCRWLKWWLSWLLDHQWGPPWVSGYLLGAKFAETEVGQVTLGGNNYVKSSWVGQLRTQTPVPAGFSLMKSLSKIAFKLSVCNHFKLGRDM